MLMRRKFLGFSAVLAAIRPAAAVPRKLDLTSAWDDFATVSREWIPAAKEYVDNPGESPINMQRKWEGVRKAFHEVDLIVRNE